MGIGGITSTNTMSAMQMTTTNITDTKSKSIQKELTDVQQKMQKLSSEEDLSVNEKTNEQKKLQKEKSDLNAELKRHQEELGRSQKRELMLAELQEAQGPKKEKDSEDTALPEKESGDTLRTEKTASNQTAEKTPPGEEAQSQQTKQPGTVIAQSSDGTVILKGTMAQAENNGTDAVQKSSGDSDEAQKTAAEKTETRPAQEETPAADDGLSDKEMHAMVSANVSAQQAGRLGSVVTKTSDGIAILKGEISQDERRGVDTERKQAELEKKERQEGRADAFRFSILGNANQAMESAAETNGPEKQADTETNAYAKAFQTSREEQAQQQFHVSIA